MIDPDRPGSAGPSSLGPRGTQLSNLGVIALGIALVLSLGLNALLGARQVRMEDEVQALRAQVEAQGETIDRLRGDIGGGSVLDAIAEAVERLRGLTFTDEVDATILTLEQLRARVDREYRKDTTRAEVEASQRVLEALGVIPTGLDLYEQLLRVQVEQVAGFYDDDAKKMVVGSDDVEDPAPLERMFLAHEYVHALTDQRFDLGRLDRLVERGADDEAAAFRALIEGEATVLMYRYAQAVLTPEEQQELVTASEQIETGQFDLLPEFLREGFGFPYGEGAAFVETLIGRGGMDAVDRAYRDPPTSTEQILHPERYLGERDDPVEVEMPDLRDTLGDEWRLLEDGGVGELDLKLIGDLQASSGGLSERDARVAADGWDGGAYAGYGRGARTVVGMVTAWDDEDEAEEALDLFSRWLPTRFENRGENFDVGEEGRGWLSDAGAGLVQLIAGRLVIILGPDRDTVLRARDAF